MDTWNITHSGYDPENYNHFAPVNTVGNGFICCRGFMEEQRAGIAGLGGIYMAGVFGRASYQPWKGEGQELVNIPNFFWLDITVDGEPLRLAPETMLDYSETLDLRNAALTRRYTYAPNGEALALFTFTRCLSRHDIHLAVQRVQVMILKDGTDIQMLFGIDPDVTNLNEVSSEPHPVQPGKKHFDVVSRYASSLCVRLHNAEETELAFAQNIEAQGAEVLQERTVFAVRAQGLKGAAVTVDKTIYAAEPKKRGESSSGSAVLNDALDGITNAPGFDSAFTAHKKAMAEFWKRADVVIEGDDETQAALRYNILQLDQSCPRHTSAVSIGARGLTGEMYEGSVFWDTEIFMLPFFCMTDPEAAKNLLMFRYNTLPEARAHAESNWFKGAMYGWQVNAKGVEQTPQGVGAYYSVHVIADIAFAVLDYWNSSGDDVFIISYGLEILIETARFWASRVTQRSDGLYDIMAVRGPNEYDVLVNNNLYTNMMARENLLECEKILQTFAGKYGEEIRAVRERLKLEQKEIEEWREIAGKLVLPFEPEQNLWLEDDTWLRRKPLDMAKAKPTAKRIIDTAIPYEALPFWQVTKQADVLHTMKNLPWHFSKEQIETAFDYYKSKTAFDSSLAYSMFALMAARLGRSGEALEHLDNCIFLDIRNVQLNTISGLHFANFGGSWQAVVFGFGGVMVMADRLVIAPNLPEHWHKLSFRLRYRGVLLELNAKNDRASVKLLEQSETPISLELRGSAFTLMNAGDTAEVTA